MTKILLGLAVMASMTMAKPLNKGSVNSNLKGANSVVKPNKYKKYDKKYDKKYKKDYKKHGSDKLERDVTKSVIKHAL
ncbi:MAG: hypothetical protein GQ531_00485 [Sulfurovum sp.]|nr:hypothetical protein [Sulfurovum sp.]